MKTRDQIRAFAEGVAWGHFYSDEDSPWEPFENYEDDWIEDQCEALADAIEQAMLWAIAEDTIDARQ
jgi:hypothetical protein